MQHLIHMSTSFVNWMMELLLAVSWVHAFEFLIISLSVMQESIHVV